MRSDYSDFFDTQLGIPWTDPRIKIIEPTERVRLRWHTDAGAMWIKQPVNVTEPEAWFYR